MDEAIGAMRRAFEALAAGRAQNQPRRRRILDTGSTLNSMACLSATISEPNFIRRIPDMGRTSTSCCTMPPPLSLWRLWKPITSVKSGRAPQAATRRTCWQSRMRTRWES